MMGTPEQLGVVRPNPGQTTPFETFDGGRDCVSDTCVYKIALLTLNTVFQIACPTFFFVSETASEKLPAPHR